MKLFLDNGWILSPENETQQEETVRQDTFFTTLTERKAQDIGTQAKVPPRQVHIINELLKLKALKHFDESMEKSDKPMVDDEKAKNKQDYEAIAKRFRLLVKKRLNKENREVISTHPTKEAKQACLAKLYEDELLQHEKVLGIDEKRKNSVK